MKYLQSVQRDILTCCFLEFFNPYSLEGFLILLAHTPTSNTMSVVCDMKLTGVSANHSQATCACLPHCTPTVESHYSIAHHTFLLSIVSTSLGTLIHCRVCVNPFCLFGWLVLVFLWFFFFWFLALSAEITARVFKESLTSEGVAPRCKYVGLHPTWWCAAHDTNHRCLETLVVRVVFSC